MWIGKDGEILMAADAQGHAAASRSVLYIRSSPEISRSRISECASTRRLRSSNPSMTAWGVGREAMLAPKDRTPASPGVTPSGSGGNGGGVLVEWLQARWRSPFIHRQ